LGYRNPLAPNDAEAKFSFGFLLAAFGEVVPATELARQALANDAEATFEWLDRAWSNRDPGISFLLYDPFIRATRTIRGLPPSGARSASQRRGG
jgi:hypothetical protein